jgi:hypothetical protein
MRKEGEWVARAQQLIHIVVIRSIIGPVSRNGWSDGAGIAGDIRDCVQRRE